MEKAARVCAYVFVVLPATAGLLAVMTIWRGYALSILWAWFAAPAFGLPVLSVPMAIGIAMVAGAFTGQKRSYAEVTDPAKKWQPWVLPFLAPAFAIGFGWVVKQYV